MPASSSRKESHFSQINPKVNIILEISMRFCICLRSSSPSYGDTICIALNTLRPRQNGRHFPDEILKWMFVNKNELILNNISWKFVPRGPINNMPPLVQIMAWRRPGDKLLSEPMMVLVTDIYMRHSVSETTRLKTREASFTDRCYLNQNPDYNMYMQLCPYNYMGCIK